MDDAEAPAECPVDNSRAHGSAGEEGPGEGRRVGTQGTGRPISEVAFNGKIQQVTIGVGDNGSVIGANPA
ncbi:hypothetical protein ACFXCZ_25750 [Streptomyces sp. NPDC059396]|uniref:hypothetical protein n=1 Tax=Streptomyces sp. NPDC059396 TaxID=3346819 RepID=UPI0036A7D090